MTDTADSECSTSWLGGNEQDTNQISVADMVAQAASSFISEQFLPGYEYCDESKMYFNRETGYYYDTNSSLFYHPSTQCYYYYSEETQTYEIYSVAQPQQKWSKSKWKKRAADVIGKDTLLAMQQTDVDAAEVVLDVVDRVAFLCGDLKLDSRPGKRSYGMMNLAKDSDELDIIWANVDSSKDVQHSATIVLEEDSEDDLVENEAEHARRMVEEEIAKHPPCIRVVELTNANALHIVTIAGASIGWGPDCDIRLSPAKTVAEKHLLISFVEEEDDQFYKIECLKSKFPAYMSGHLFKKGTYCKLQHGDVLTVGDNSLVFHIHKGLNTCPSCEPGLLAKPPEVETGQRLKITAESQRRKNIRQMKQQFGLLETNQNVTNYVDRAKQRRKEVGSEPANTGGIYAGCAATPLPGATAESVVLKSGTANSSQQPTAHSAALGEGNKGFKLLKGMGWSEGKGLGKTEQGIVGPIATELRADRAGLGSEVVKPTTTKVSIKLNKRQEVLMKTKERYEQAEKKMGK